MDLLNYLQQFAPEGKIDLFEEKIKERTKHITVVLEDIFQPHNASAVLRSCDCFGVQDVHIIENRYKYQVNPDVALGSSKWLNLHKHNQNEENTIACFKRLKEQGYKVIATTPHKNDFSLYDIPVNEKLAIVFGTEKEGLSETALSHADGYMRIPMYGFTESFNISVSAALSLYELTKRIRENNINWQLNDEDKNEVLLQWTKSAIKSADLLVEKFNELNQK